MRSESGSPEHPIPPLLPPADPPLDGYVRGGPKWQITETRQAQYPIILFFWNSLMPWANAVTVSRWSSISSLDFGSGGRALSAAGPCNSCASRRSLTRRFERMQIQFCRIVNFVTYMVCSSFIDKDGICIYGIRPLALRSGCNWIHVP